MLGVAESIRNHRRNVEFDEPEFPFTVAETKATRLQWNKEE
jgi:hypothetical protein